MTQHYDLIGDIHGHYKPLIALLEKLGYSNSKDHYQHNDRKVIFLGDFIDRGPDQREVINTVKSMIDNNSALAVMGNHEFNALCFHTEAPDRPGTYLRPRNEKNNKQHKAFLDAYQDDPDELNEVLAWFRTLPMWLDLEDLKVIHACWDEKAIGFIKSTYSRKGLITDNFLIDSSRKGTAAYLHLETILKGKEIPLPEGHRGIPDKAGIIRHLIRVRWWDNTATTYKDAYLGPEVVINTEKKPVSIWTHIPDDKLDGDHLITYSVEAPPVFLGHYWLEGKPKRLAKNIACLDYSVAQDNYTKCDKENSGDNPKLVAYCWDGEWEIDDEKFEWVEKAQ